MARSRWAIVGGAIVVWLATGLGQGPAAQTHPATAIVVAQRPKPAPQSDTVYVTRTGEKYHRGTCRSLRKSRIETTVAEAKRRSFTACKICKPPA